MPPPPNGAAPVPINQGNNAATPPLVTPNPQKTKRRNTATPQQGFSLLVQGVVDRLSEFRCGQGTRFADARRVCCKAMRASEWPPRLELPRRAAAHRAALRGDATASPVATARTAKLRKPRRRFPAGFNRQQDPSRACDLFSPPPGVSPDRSEAERSQLSRTLY